MCSKPAEMRITLSNPLTWAGVDRSFVDPSPSWPRSLWPQVHTVPSALKRHRVVTPGRDGNCVRQSDDGNGSRPGGLGTVAQLARLVVSPRPHGAVPLQATGVRVSRRYGDHARQLAYLLRSGMVGRRAIAQLAQMIVAPRPDAAVILERHGVRIAGRDRYHALQSHSREWESRISTPTRLRSHRGPPSGRPQSRWQSRPSIRPLSEESIGLSSCRRPAVHRHSLPTPRHCRHASAPARWSRPQRSR